MTGATTGFSVWVSYAVTVAPETVVAAVFVIPLIGYIIYRTFPEGSLTGTVQLQLIQSGLSRRTATVQLVAAVVGTAIILFLIQPIGVVESVVVAVYIAAVFVGGIALANRSRAEVLSRATPNRDTDPGTKAVVAESVADTEKSEQEIHCPITGEPAPCQIIAVQRYDDSILQTASRYSKHFWTTTVETYTYPLTTTPSETTVEINTDTAWLGLLKGSPTNLHSSPAATSTQTTTATGGQEDGEGHGDEGGVDDALRESGFDERISAVFDREETFDEGDVVPEAVRTHPIASELPVDSDGQVHEPFRLQGSTVEPGDDIVAVGTVQQGVEYGEETLVLDDEDAFIARGTVETVQESLDRATSRNLILAAVGIGLTVTATAILSL